MVESGYRNVFENGVEYHKNLEALIDQLADYVDLLVDGKFDELPTRTINTLKLRINAFEDCPSSLDSRLDKYMGQFTDMYLKIKSNAHAYSSVPDVCKEIADVIYCFAKVRGFKKITTFFPSDIYLLSQLVSKGKDNSLLVEEHFLVLLWLCNLVLIPFPLESVEKGSLNDIFLISIKFIEHSPNGSRNQIISLILLSRLLTRKDAVSRDMSKTYFRKYVQGAFENIQGISLSKLGHLMTINRFMKRCKYKKLERFSDFVLDRVILPEIAHIRNSRHLHLEIDNLVIVYIIKLVGKISNYEMSLEDDMRFQKIANYINILLYDIMLPLKHRFDTSLRYPMAKTLAFICAQLSHLAINYKEQLVLHLIDRLNLKNLKILYSPFEKSELPYNCFQDSLVLETDEVIIPRYHTVLLFLGYLILQGTFPVHLLPIVLSITHQTLFLQQKRFMSNLGSQLRDSTCFILWAFCRMKDSGFRVRFLEDSLMIETVFFDLLDAIVFDEDLVIRRCAVAVMQEFLGRFGNLFFKSRVIARDLNDSIGKLIISLIGVFDNHSLGNLDSTYQIIPRLHSIGIRKDYFFDRLLANVMEESSFEVVKLSANLLKCLLEDSQPCEIDIKFERRTTSTHLSLETAISSLVGMISSSDYSLYPLASLCSVLTDCDMLEQVHRKVEQDFTMNIHVDPQEKGECYLSWITLILERSTNLQWNRMWNTIICVSKVNTSHSLLQLFKTFFKLLRKKNRQINMSDFHELVHELQNGNITISGSIFDYAAISEVLTDELIMLCCDEGTSCEVRAALLDNLSEMYSSVSISQDQKRCIIELLDDYTTTMQGDVGSKVRLSVLRLLHQNWLQFQDLREAVEVRLIRLSGELIEKIKIESFGFIKELILDNNNAEYLDFPFITFLQFYRHNIMKYAMYGKGQHISELSRNFWKGAMFSLGAITANISTISANLTEFFLFLRDLDASELDFVFNEMLALLKKGEESPSKYNPSRKLKENTMTLSTFVRLFEANYILPKNFSYKALFVRSYNLHINTSNTLRIGLVLRLFQYLTLCDNVDSGLRKQARERVCKISCTHTLARVRAMGSEILFEIANEKEPQSNIINLIQTVDWEDLPQNLKVYYSSLINAFALIP